MSSIGVGIGLIIVATIFVLIIYKKLLCICGPNEVLIFSGKRVTGDQLGGGYRWVKGGRKVRVPLFETVDRMDLTNMAIKVEVKGAFSKGGIPLNVDGVANVKIGGDKLRLRHAVERLLGIPRNSVMNIAKETLEGNLRGVLATMTPEEVNSDKIRFAKELKDEADHDLQKLGLELDTMNIQNVSDEVGYLNSIGRISSAEVRKEAVIAEATNRALSVIRDSKNVEEAELVAIDAAIRTLEAHAARQLADAESQRAAFVAEAEGAVYAQIAEAQAQMDVQRARIKQVQQRLEADVIARAQAQMTARVNKAQGDAATIVEDGRATADVLRQITAAWRSAGANARDVFLMQKLEPLVETLCRTVQGVRVDRLTVLGTSGSDRGGDLAQRLIGASEQLKAALGVDLVGALQQRLPGTVEPALREVKDTQIMPQAAPPPNPGI